MRSLLRWLFAICRATGGVSAVEFALTAPIVALVVVQLVDIGLAAYRQQQVQNAAQAGARYAAMHGWNSTAIESAVAAATGLAMITATPAPRESCGCPSGSGVVTASCGTTCSDGAAAGTYVTVSAQAAYSPITRYSVLGSSVTLTAQSVVRIW
jgi:Flp pilus assembly protein TadG